MLSILLDALTLNSLAISNYVMIDAIGRHKLAYGKEKTNL